MSISIALCTYNGEKYIAEQLQSILNQQLLPDEIIVCDDGSTDATLDIVRQVAVGSYVKINIWQNVPNLGVVKNFAKAISLCSGNFVALSDQDDVWLPNKLQLTYDYLNQASHSHLDMVFTDLMQVDENLQDLNQTMWKFRGFDKRRQDNWEKGNMLQDLLRHENTVTGSTILMRRKFAQQCVPFLNQYAGDRLHDEIIALLAIKNNAIGFINQPTVLYRQHTGQVTKQFVNEQLHETDTDAFYRICAYNLKHLEDIKQLGFNGSQLAYINNYIKHLQIRLKAKKHYFVTLPQIAGEMINRNYYIYSNGFRSFLKDIFKPH